MRVGTNRWIRKEVKGQIYYRGLGKKDFRDLKNRI